MKLAGECAVYATNDYQVQDVLNHVAGIETPYRELRVHNFATLSLDSKGIAGWTKVGTAKMEIEFFSVQEIQGETVEALKAEIASVQAEAQNKITELTRKLNEVLAITMESPND